MASNGLERYDNEIKLYDQRKRQLTYATTTSAISVRNEELRSLNKKALRGTF